MFRDIECVLQQNKNKIQSELCGFHTWETTEMPSGMPNAEPVPGFAVCLPSTELCIFATSIKNAEIQSLHTNASTDAY